MSEHVIVADLGYGDAGKGTVVDWLCATRPVHAVIRFNGGAQAAHNVVLPDGRHHTFAQFGSGTLRGVPTHLSRFVVVDPLALSAEAAHLVRLGVPDPFGLLTFDEGFRHLAGIRPRTGKGQEVHCLDAYQLRRGLTEVRRIGDLQNTLSGYMRSTSMLPVSFSRCSLHQMAPA